MILRIIIIRVRNKIKPEIAEEQCGFLEGNGARKNANAILERALELQ